MAENLLGKFTTAQHRDAMHVAVIPAELTEEVTPGTPVAVIGGRAYTKGGIHVGIVDPFLEGPTVGKGRKVWVLIYPNQVTDLRHEWSHAFIPDESDTQDSYEDDCRYC